VSLTFNLEIWTPERVFFSDDVEMIVVSTPQGEMGILAGHVNLVAAVAVGTSRIRKENGEWVEAVLTEGFMEVKQGKVIIITDSADWPHEIDANRAEAAKKRAEERLAIKLSGAEYARSQAALSRALARLKITGQYIKDYK
jgi:F-type H+-transporting ATPase subunit epsilon